MELEEHNLQKDDKPTEQPKESGVLDTEKTEAVEIDDVLSNFEEFAAHLPDYLRPRYLKRLESALANPSEVASVTAVKGLFFELSRIVQVLSDGSEDIDFDLLAGEEIEVSYMGFPKKGADISMPPTKELRSGIDLDVPISRNGKPYVYEAKSYPRMAYGSLPSQRNQILKYQQAIDSGLVDGASIEVRGRIDREFLDWVTGDAIDQLGATPDVEIIYTLDLPSGAEYRFVLKRANGRNGLNFENPDYTDPEDQKIIRGVQKAILNRNIIGVIASTTTDLEVDPMDIKQLDEYHAYDQARKDSLHSELAVIADTIVNFSNEQSALSPEANPVFVEQTVRELQDYLRQNPDRSKAQQGYVLREEDIPVVVSEVMRRIEQIRESEVERSMSQEEATRRQERTAAGYDSSLPIEGTALNIEHIIMDSIQSIKKGDESRSYDRPESFKTVQELAEYLTDDLDRSHREVTIYNPITGEHEKISGTSDQGVEKVVMNLLKHNTSLAFELIEYAYVRVEELGALDGPTTEERLELSRLSSVVKGMEQMGQKLASFRDEIANLNEVKVSKIKSVQNSEKALIREEYDSQIKRIYEKMQDILIQVVGGKEDWDKMSSRIVEDKTQEIIKFIYVVDAQGNIRTDEEKFRGKLSGRAAHSELAAGKNVYGAGELIFSKVDGRWVVTELNNGSGHYRPSSLTLKYVANVLSEAGLDMGQARAVDSLLRGAQLADASLI